MRSGRASLKAGVSAASMKFECFKSEENDGPSSVMKAYWENQIKRRDAAYEGERDALLILDDGIIEAHAAILSGSSEFFRNIFETQGFVLDPVRKIIMPEFPVRVVEKVLKLVYKEEVYVKSQKEGDEIRNAQMYLGINVDSKLILSKISKSKVPDSVGVENLKVIPVTAKSQLLVQSEVKKPLVLLGGDLNPNKKALQPLVKLPARLSKSASQERVAGAKSESESHTEHDSDSDDDYVAKSRKLKKQQKNKIVVRQSDTMKPLSIQVEKLPATTINSKANENGKPSEPVKQKPERSKDKSADDTDTSTDYDADEARYKNQKWFLSESKRCQKCKTDHDSAALASQCLTGHGRLRCYFCFRVVRNTELLFNHFQRAHKKAGRENFVMCPFCDQSIPFKSVSCHVISLHLTDSSRTPKMVNVGRPSLPAVNTPPTKRPKLAEGSDLKQDDLRVGRLDCTIKHVRGNGKTWVFVLQRDRP